jgi:putative transposase
MDLQSLAPTPTTSRASPEHKKYPYLLRSLEICRPNEVWATDITYIPLALGFAYLVAIMDWYTRLVLAWRLSSTLETGFCIEALLEALQLFPRRDIQHGPRSPVHPTTRSQACSWAAESRSAWTARGAASTTSSWSGFGAP